MSDTPNSNVQEPSATAPPIITLGGRAFTVLFPDLIPPPDEEDLRDLRTSIAAAGVEVPVVIDERDGVIDGINRLRIAAEVGLPLDRVPFLVRSGLSLDEKRELALRLNVDRRHLAMEVKRDLRRRQVRSARYAGKSIRAIAAELGLHKTQVERDLAAGVHSVDNADQVQGDERVVGRDGHSYPARRSSSEDAAAVQQHPAQDGRHQDEVDVHRDDAEEEARPTRRVVIQVSSTTGSEPKTIRVVYHTPTPEEEAVAALKQRVGDLGRAVATVAGTLENAGMRGSAAVTDPVWFHTQRSTLDDLLEALAALTAESASAPNPQAERTPNQRRRAWIAALSSHGFRVQELGRELLRRSKKPALRNDRPRLLELLDALARVVVELRAALPPEGAAA